MEKIKFNEFEKECFYMLRFLYRKKKEPISPIEIAKLAKTNDPHRKITPALKKLIKVGYVKNPFKGLYIPLK
ncbi:MAG: hypothetical protein ACOCRK_02175 [bacterium]